MLIHNGGALISSRIYEKTMLKLCDNSLVLEILSNPNDRMERTDDLNLMKCDKL